MPTGYLVTLGDNSLDAGDAISGAAITFTTATNLGAGQWQWSGTWGGSTFTDTLEPGVFYLGTDNNVYFVPDYGLVDTLTASSVISSPSFTMSNGIVEDDGDGTLIGDGFTDDDGDEVNGSADNADSIQANGGDDTVQSGAGNDTIEGGAGNDVIDGGTGDDEIYGDGTLATGSSEELNWSDQGADGTDVTAGFTQTTGEMQVSVGFTNTGNNAPEYTIERTDLNYVAPGEDFANRSSLLLFGNGDDTTSTTTIDFTAAPGSEMQDAVENVSFRINDIDWAAGNHTDIVTVNAYDIDGNPITVTFTVGGGDTVTGNTITANEAGESQADLGGSVLIEIAGPVSQIEILYANGQGGTQGIWVTDVHFDTLPQEAGDDSLSGGAGSDTLVGGDGDDTLAGGADGDDLSGGQGMDFLDYSASDAAVDIDLGANTASGGHATGDTLSGGLDGIIGSDWDDTLTGYDAQGPDWTNVFYGGAGDDLMDGAGGDDSLFGEDGDDTIFGGTGADVMDGGADNDTLHVGSQDTASGGSGDDIFIIDPADLGGTITIDGGEGDETNGDSINFNGLLSSITYTSTDPDNLSGSAELTDGTTVNFTNIEQIVICFTKGTRILTPYGARLIETLSADDLVLTRDNGVQPIRWIGQKTVAGSGKFAPIRFAKGVLGNERDLLVSPQHRMLHHSVAANLYFNDSEVLIPAKHMVNDTTITQNDQAEVTYFHMLFDSHEIVFAEGTASESFHPGQMGLSALSDPAREELFALFPELRSNPNGYGDAARLSLRAHESRLLVA